MQCCSQAVGHRKQCDEIAFHKMCNVTHLLLVIGKDVVRLPFQKMCTITHCLLVIGKDEMRLLFTNMCNVAYLLLVKGKDMPFTKKWNETHFLLVIGKDCDQTGFHKNVQCYPQSVGHRRRCDQTKNVHCHSLPVVHNILRMQ